jgi:hypothetical protein
MTEFKGTKGKWAVDNQSGMVVCNHQAIASAWLMSTDDLEIRLDGESWLDMRNRTLKEREVLTKLVPKANSLLISKAPEMLEMLVNIIESELLSGSTTEPKIKQLIKEATEL